MKAPRGFRLLTPLIVVAALAMSADQSAARGATRGGFGRPLDGLSMNELKLFRDGKATFSEVEDEADGLGPIFNNTGCAVCHSSPAVGGASDILETRAARVANGRYFELPGGSLFQDQAISPACAETIPSDANVIANGRRRRFSAWASSRRSPTRTSKPTGPSRRASIRTGGARQPRRGRGKRGTRVGRFGWKSQQATLLPSAATPT